MADTSPSRLIAWVLMALVILISAFTHLYRIDQTFIFNNDEGRDALIAYRMIDTKRPVLLGPETSVGNMYLGPFYYYLMVPPLLLAKLNPVGPAIMVALLGIATTVLLIFLGKKNGSLTSGLVAGIFYALSPIMVHYSRSSWNPNVIPFFITIILLVVPLKSMWLSFVFGALTGAIFQLHYVALVIPVLLYLWQLYSNYKEHKLVQFLTRTTPIIILGFFATTLPFWLFELRHEFVNLNAFFTYLFEKSQISSVDSYPGYLSRLWLNLSLVIKGGVASLSESAVIPNTSLLLTIAAMLLLYIVKVKGLYSYLFIGSLLIISVLRETIHIHYISFLFPLIAVIFGQSITKKWLLAIITAIVLLWLWPATIKSLKYNLHDIVSVQTVRAQNLSNYIVAQAAGRKYNIVSPTTSSTATLLYYLAISSNPPQTSDQSLLFILCEGSVCSDSIATDTDLFVNGPSHPTIIDYLGYTPRLHTEESRQIIKNEWVTYELYVATVLRNP